MPVLSTAIGLGLAGASAASKAIGAHKAASAQQSGAQQALTLEQQNQKNAIDAQNTATSTNQANQAPFLSLGQTSAGKLGNLLDQGFTAPTIEQAEQNPGYQFALQSGTDALDKSAAATGNLFSGTQGVALQKFGQNLGTQNYQQVYNNALNDYMTKYQTLLGGTGVGQQSASELGQLGQSGAQNIANIDLTGGQQQASQLNNAAAARASGYQGVSSAISNGLNYGANVFMQQPQLNSGAQIGDPNNFGYST